MLGDLAGLPYFFPHFLSRTSPIVPPEIVSPSTGLPRKIILVSSLYSFGPDLYQALHGASMRHSLNVLTVQVKVWLGPSSAKPGAVAPINNINAINTVECRGITVSDELEWFRNNECTAFQGPLWPEQQSLSYRRLPCSHTALARAGAPDLLHAE